MNFISIQFGVFFFIVFFLLLLVKDIKKQNIILLFASYIFYFLGDYRFLWLLVILSFAMWAIGLKIGEHNSKSKSFLVLGVTIALIVLGFFKYFNFFVGSFCNILGLEYNALKILLPVGISFYIFQALSYLFDIYYKKIEPEKELIYVLLYIGFFPQIVSGPIVKAHHFLPQLKKERVINWDSLSYGFQIFLKGLFKKKVLADRLAVCVEAVYGAPSEYDTLSIVLALISFLFQLYFDFSGYSDMAIGVASAMGFDLGVNFNLPFLARNQSEYWRRWHISLSSWFKEYVYIPLGGSRKGAFRTYINVFITMLLSGIWHGASWSYVLWGVISAVLSILHKFSCDVRKKYNIPIRKEYRFSDVFVILLNFISLILMFIPFRTQNMADSWLMLKSVFVFKGGITYISVFTVIYIILMIVVGIVAAVKNGWNDPVKPLDLTKFHNKVILICFIIVIIVFSYIGDTAFIYAQF